MGQVLLAGEEAHERSALVRDVVADRAARHRRAGFECVEDRAQRGRTIELLEAKHPTVAPKTQDP
jgi:hypothetical protein